MMENLRKWYAEFCESEYGIPIDQSVAEFDTGSDVGLLYSTFDVGSEEHDIQIDLSTAECALKVYVDNALVFVDAAESLDALFHGLVYSTWDEIYNAYLDTAWDFVGREGDD